MRQLQLVPHQFPLAHIVEDFDEERRAGRRIAKRRRRKDRERARQAMDSETMRPPSR